MTRWTKKDIENIEKNRVVGKVLKPTTKKLHPEYELQKQVARFINVKYPNVQFDSDTIASVKLTMQQAVRNKAIQKAGFKRPDIAIYEPNKNFHGLFIELKTESPFKKNGDLKSNEHIEGQNETMNELRSKGYDCHFAWTFGMAAKIIDDYLRNR